MSGTGEGDGTSVAVIAVPTSLAVLFVAVLMVIVCVICAKTTRKIRKNQSRQTDSEVNVTNALFIEGETF